MDDKLNLKEIIAKHAAWIENETGGVKANLSSANLSGADLRNADLSNADLSSADLSNANLLSANLSNANLRYANLRYANLRNANLSNANLRYANLRYANLRNANLSGANLSQSKGLPTAREFMSKFDTDGLGVIVYKRIGKTEFGIPDTWKIEPGSFIEEVVNPLPILDCACGVNFGTLEWCSANYTEVALWRCRIRWIDLADVVVPFNSDGKARCGRLELLEIVE
jgi:hypothetical protein